MRTFKYRCAETLIALVVMPVLFVQVQVKLILSFALAATSYLLAIWNDD